MAEQSVDAGSLQSAFTSDLTHYPTQASPAHAAPASPAPASPAPAAAEVSAPATNTHSATAPIKQPAAADVQAAVARANANLASSNRVLDYRVDAATGLTIAIVRNAQTGALVQQIPGADIIALAQMLAEWSPGKHVLLDLIA
ncbi:MAG: flagellar protein FlaG [Sinobacteraceae bacterium]|nr:flagellar protein FlaG [Nevskiaceae bacterium]